MTLFVMEKVSIFCQKFLITSDNHKNSRIISPADPRDDLGVQPWIVIMNRNRA